MIFKVSLGFFRKPEELTKFFETTLNESDSYKIFKGLQYSLLFTRKILDCSGCFRKLYVSLVYFWSLHNFLLISKRLCTSVGVSRNRYFSLVKFRNILIHWAVVI
jgi:hypothetical protein